MAASAYATDIASEHAPPLESEDIVGLTFQFLAARLRNISKRVDGPAISAYEQAAGLMAAMFPALTQHCRWRITSGGNTRAERMQLAAHVTLWEQFVAGRKRILRLYKEAFGDMASGNPLVSELRRVQRISEIEARGPSAFVRRLDKDFQEGRRDQQQRLSCDKKAIARSLGDHTNTVDSYIWAHGLSAGPRTDRSLLNVKGGFATLDRRTMKRQILRVEASGSPSRRLDQPHDGDEGDALDRFEDPSATDTIMLIEQIEDLREQLKRKGLTAREQDLAFLFALGAARTSVEAAALLRGRDGKPLASSTVRVMELNIRRKLTAA